MGICSIYRDTEQPQEKKTSNNELSSDFLGVSFSYRNNLRPQSDLEQKVKAIFLKNRPIHFHINKTTVIRPVKWNKLSFPRIEINKPLLTPVHSVSQIRFQFRSQFKLLSRIRCLVTLRIKSSIISIDSSNITDNIVRKVINV